MLRLANAFINPADRLGSYKVGVEICGKEEEKKVAASEKYWFFKLVVARLRTKNGSLLLLVSRFPYKFSRGGL